MNDEPDAIFRETDWSLIPIHPAAAKWPMMSENEIIALAEDIEANGQKESISLWFDEGHPGIISLIDGRNRLAALKLLGKEPAYHVITEGDPVKYVISKNLHRRHLTQEQKREMIAAFIAIEPMESDLGIAKVLGVSHTTVAEARRVQNCQNGKNEHRPIERAAAAIEADPELSVRELQQAAKVSVGTAFKAKQKRKAPDPPGSASKNKARVETMRMKAAIWHNLKDALTGIGGLPRPDEVARIAKTYDRADFIEEMLPRAEHWLREFRACRDQIQK
jgi:ParB-like chromosome segregation protein Spo0J